jgi:hypothetical protein
MENRLLLLQPMAKRVRRSRCGERQALRGGVVPL